MKNFKKNGGFTLVELIVVIAILAILAAVAIPAYSGYIEKANKAGDEQLLAAVNRAFASACSTNGDDIYLVKNVKSIKLADGKIPEDAVYPYGEDFWAFYDGNEDSKFKIYDMLYFNSKTCSFSFVDPAVSSVIGGIQTSLSGSSYAGKEGAMLNEIQILTNIMESAAGSVSVETLESLLGGEFGAYLDANNIPSDDPQAIANHAMLFVANQMSSDSVNKNGIKDVWANNNFSGSAISTINQYKAVDGVSTMGAMALYYANMEACVQNLKNTEGLNESTVNDVVAAFEQISVNMNAANGDVDVAMAQIEEGRKAIAQIAQNDTAVLNALMGYGAGNQNKDADAFLNAMNAINSSSGELGGMTNQDNMYGDLADIFG